jgi:hypothetical protein
MPQQSANEIVNELLNTRGVIGVNGLEPERAMQLINDNQARTPLTPEQVYIFPMELSNQNVDSYGTRMSDSTLRNYQDDFSVGRALMNSHRTGGFLGGSELPIGRTFYAELSGLALPMSARYEDVGGQRLTVYAYIQRGIQITDVSSDHLIAGIEGGTIKDTSVGFARGDNSQYLCSICGSNLDDWESCTHVPGARYENGRCYAWVDNFRGREASLVYKGSTPDAMIEKASRMAATGMLARADAVLLGEEWGVRLFGERTFAVKKREIKGGEGKPKMDWENLLADLRGIDQVQGDRIAALEEGARPAALMSLIRADKATIQSLKPRAELGDKWMDDLVEQAVKARVRAEGNGFDGEKYSKMLRASNDPDLIKGEIASWERTAKGILGDGKRPTGGQTADNKPGRAASPRSYKG